MSARARTKAAMTAILLSGVAMMTRNLDAPIHGSFCFRQAHVAARIEHFVENGPSLVPATYSRRDQFTSRQIETTGPGRSTLPGR